MVQRKVGPGQYITSGSADPVFMIGDLSTVWLIAFVRETEAPNVTGQTLNFKVLAYPEQVFKANMAYVATAIDTNTRRLLVRAVIDNSEGLLRPEMFASVSILTDEGDLAFGSARCRHIRGRAGPCLGRSGRQGPGAAPHQARASSTGRSLK